MRKIVFFSVILIMLFFISGCSVPFSVSTDESVIEIPNTYGTYHEVEVDVPQDIQDHANNLDYDKIVCHYVVEKNNSFATELEVFISLDTIADDVQKDSDEKLIDVSLGLNDDRIEGEQESELLKLALKQKKFVVGVKNLEYGSPSEKTTVKLYFTVEGTYKIF